MKYNVGDRVKIRNDLIVGEKYGGLTYMCPMAIEVKENDIVTISETGVDLDGIIWYEFKELHYSYSEAMIEGLAEESTEKEEIEKELTDREKFEGWMGKLCSLGGGHKVWEAFNELTYGTVDTEHYNYNLKIVSDYLFGTKKKKMTKAEIEDELGYEIEIVE